jgi:hypothetical protein
VVAWADIRIDLKNKVTKKGLKIRRFLILS